MKVCVTGGAGFIGANFVHHIASRAVDITVIDKLTYAGKRERLDGLSVEFKHLDICDMTEDDFEYYDYIYHFAAASHVDRSIDSPDDFLRDNIIGTVNLLQLCKKVGVGRFVYVSTDEVYGSVSIPSRESDILHPSSAYSASKVASEVFCNAYYKTFGVPIVITRSSNNFGRFQHEEKFIPKIITNAAENKKIPVYGDGSNIRDWLFVHDNCEAIEFVGKNGVIGEIYNIGGGMQKTNIELVLRILDVMNKPKSLIEFVPDRLGHDFEYNIDSFKLRRLGWTPSHDFEVALRCTVEWYKKHGQ